MREQASKGKALLSELPRGWMGGRLALVAESRCTFGSHDVFERFAEVERSADLGQQLQLSGGELKILDLPTPETSSAGFQVARSRRAIRHRGAAVSGGFAA